MVESHSAEIRELHLFAAMEEANFDALMRAGYVQNFPPQIELISEGDPSDFLHIVLSGSVDLFSSWNGRETSMATIYPIATFILAATIRDAPYLMSARTLEKSRLVLVPSSDVRAIFDRDHGFARAIVTELARSYRMVVKAQKNLKLRSSTERLGNYLLHEHRTGSSGNRFDLDTEKRRLASLLGMTPENLSRSFKRLRNHGVVVNANEITITDADALAAFSNPNPLIDDHSA